MLLTPRAPRLAAAAFAAFAVVGLAGCATATNTTGMPTPNSTSPAAATPSTTTTPAAGPHNAADVMFVQMMVPHHQQAIEMSDILLAKEGINPQVTALARQIKAAQAPEIAQMSGWLVGWGQNPSPSMGMDHDMGGGMMSQADLDALEKATGTEAARLFLTGMISHHQGAIAMAKNQLTSGQNPQVKQLAESIIEAQQAEIATMNRLLTQL